MSAPSKPSLSKLRTTSNSSVASKNDATKIITEISSTTNLTFTSPELEALLFLKGSTPSLAQDSHAPNQNAGSSQIAVAATTTTTKPATTVSAETRAPGPPSLPPLRGQSSGGSAVGWEPNLMSASLFDSPAIEAMMALGTPFTPLFTPQPPSGHAPLVLPASIVQDTHQEPRMDQTAALEISKRHQPQRASTATQSTTPRDSEIQAHDVHTGSSPMRERVMRTRWSPELMAMSIKELREFIRLHPMSDDDVAHLKAERRRAQNRGYKRKERVQQVASQRQQQEQQQGEEDEEQLQPTEEEMSWSNHRLAREAAALRKDISVLTARADRLDALLASRKK